VSDQDELGRLLEFEHAAVYGYGLAGAVLATTTPPARAGLMLALAGLQTHRDRRDALIAKIVSAGGTPPPGDAAYRYPRPDGTKAALALIADIEDSVAAACHDALGRLDSGSLRTQVAGYLGNAATASARARLLSGAGAARATTAFPGGE
jgi:hypothetical protein